METDDEREPKSGQWIGRPLSDAAIRHLDWKSFDAQSKGSALDALRAEQPTLYDTFMLRDELQEDAAKKLGIKQPAVSRRLDRAYRFLANYLLATESHAPEIPSLLTVAKGLGLSRQQLARELIPHLQPGEIGEALGFDPPQFASLIRGLRRHPERMRRAVEAVESEDM